MVFPLKPQCGSNMRVTDIKLIKIRRQNKANVNGHVVSAARSPNVENQFSRNIIKTDIKYQKRWIMSTFKYRIFQKPTRNIGKCNACMNSAFRAPSDGSTYCSKSVWAMSRKHYKFQCFWIISRIYDTLYRPHVNDS